MSLGSISIITHRTQPASIRLVIFWLGFAVLLVLATLALVTPPASHIATAAQQPAPGGPKHQGGGLFEVGEVPTNTPETPTTEPVGPTNTPLPPPPTDIPVPTVVTPTAVDTLVPPPIEVTPDTPVPLPTILTSTPATPSTPVPPSDTPTPEITPTASASITPSDTPETPGIPKPSPTSTPIPDVTESAVTPTDTDVKTPIPGKGEPTNTPKTITPTPTVEITTTPGLTSTPGLTTTTTPDINPTPGTPDEPTIPAASHTPKAIDTDNFTATPTPVSNIFATAVIKTPVGPLSTTPTRQPTVRVTATEEFPIILTVTVSRTRAPTSTSTVIAADPISATNVPTATSVTPVPTSIPTSDLTATALNNATATASTRGHETATAAIATSSAAVQTAQDPDSSPDDIATAFAARSTAESALATVIPAAGIERIVNTPAPAFEKAMTATVAANAGAPILVYTYTQQINANGENIVAACIWNLGTVAATNVDVQFDARAPAMFTAGRIPSEQSEISDQQVKVRIANLNPQTLRQIEVGVIRAANPLEWISVAIPSAYALDHPGDPPFPASCTATGIQSAESISREVQIEVGGRYNAVNERSQVEQERNIDPGVLSIAVIQESAPAFSSFVLYCVIGLILALLLVMSLLAMERRKRVQPAPRRQQRATVSK